MGLVYLLVVDYSSRETSAVWIQYRATSNSLVMLSTVH